LRDVPRAPILGQRQTERPMLPILRRGLLAAPILVPAAARAQGAWPERAVRIIVPFPPHLQEAAL